MAKNAANSNAADHAGANKSKKTGFPRWHCAGFTSELLPIIPPAATLSPDSKVPLKSRGKVPGKLTSNGWVGFKKWSELTTTLDHLKQWHPWNANVGLQGRKFPGLDIDVEDKKLSHEIEKLAYDKLGRAPRRGRAGSQRCLLLYRLKDGETPIRKRRDAFLIGKTEHAVELLAAGQYFNVEGEHPDGTQYAWPDWHPCDTGPASLTPITAEQADAFRTALLELLEMYGYPVASEQSSSSGPGTRKGLDDPSLHAPSPEMVLDALKVWRPEHMAHGEYVQAIAAIKAALGPRREEFRGDVLEWSPGVRSGEDDQFEARWTSIDDAELGWSFVEATARKFGYSGSAQLTFADTPAVDPESLGGSISETAIEKALRKYVWVQKLERYVHLATGEMLSAKAFCAANVRVAPFGRSGVQSAEAEFQNHPKASNSKAVIPTYRPGRGVLITDTNERGRPVKAVNLWRPSSLVPATNVADDDVRPWLDHVKLIFGELDGAAVAHFLNFVAFLLQRPGEKINHALVIVGKTQGTGKDTAFVPVIQAIGLHNVATITPEVLAGPWTHYLLAQLVRAEEMMNFGRREMANKLKPMLCTPPEMVSINTKNVKQFDVPNLQNWIMFTNHEDAISIEDTDRRYWVHRCELEVPCEPAYYAKLYGWYEAGGCEKVAGWLLQRDLGAFSPMSAPPSTEAKRAMAVQSQSKQVRWTYEALTAGDFAGRSVVLCEELIAAASGFDGDGPGGVNSKNVAVAFKAAGFKQVSWHTKIDGKVRQLWIRDRDGSLARLSADQLRAKYFAEHARGAATEAA
jgi:Family of unknown function (DUF5906)